MFAVNSLLYLNQSVPPYGVSLNSQTNGTTAFPLRKHSHPPISANLTRSGNVTLVIRGFVLSFLRDAGRSEDHPRLLPVRLHRLRQNGHLAERRGNVSRSDDGRAGESERFRTHAHSLSCSYVLTLITDGMRSVRAFHFDKAAASVLTTCVSSARGRRAGREMLYFVENSYF